MKVRKKLKSNFQMEVRKEYSFYICLRIFENESVLGSKDNIIQLIN